MNSYPDCDKGLRKPFFTTWFSCMLTLQLRLLAYTAEELSRAMLPLSVIIVPNKDHGSGSARNGLTRPRARIL